MLYTFNAVSSADLPSLYTVYRQQYFAVLNDLPVGCPAEKSLFLQTMYPADIKVVWSG